MKTYHSAETLKELIRILDEEYPVPWDLGDTEAIHCYIDNEGSYNADLIHSACVHQFHPDAGKVLKINPMLGLPPLEEDDFVGGGENVGWDY